ncbi:MAG: HD-GYP domain-containing protein [Planctomycetota bacterium]
MLSAAPTTAERPTSALPGPSVAESRLLARLDEAFGQTFAVIDSGASVLERVSADWPRVDLFRWIALCEHVARTRRVELIEEHAPLAMLAAPLPPGDPLLGSGRVAVAVVLTEPVESIRDIESAAGVFGIDAGQALQWASNRRPIPAGAAYGLAAALLEAETATDAVATLKGQLSETSGQLIATFEELNVLHRLTERLSLDHTERDLCEHATTWLAEVVAADAVVGVINETVDVASAVSRAEGDTGPKPFTTYLGPTSLVEGDLGDFFDRLGDEAQRRSVVLNRDRTASPTWCYPGVREVVSAPILANGKRIGWLAALNRVRKPGLPSGGFGAVEASLLGSVAAILGVHAGNRRRLAEHEELFGDAVRALSSAIDAKDPYTCGHSDRVARIAVRLAEQLGLGAETLKEIYLGGLLHDVGKIGIDDAVLRKPDRLTDEEYDHIKAHPELGVRILSGVRQLRSVLPLVGHHHEMWDGGGYPSGLRGDETPLPARIMAVADSIDAMKSDRPYRKGMPREKVEAILRDGAGTQWDPEVIDAYFASADDILDICGVERRELDLDVSRWGELAGAVTAHEPRR